MRILLCHTFYQQRGGEDESFLAEAELLESHGHDIIRYTKQNDELQNVSRLKAANMTFWNWETYREVGELIDRHRPEVMHCTNTFPLLSPSIYFAARQRGVAVVQSLRNYRQLCPSALFMRDEQVCEDCLGKGFAWPGVWHGCYRGSRLATAVVAGAMSFHRAWGTWSSGVDLYFTLSKFARDKYIAAGWPADKIRVKPNFLSPAPQPGTGQGNYAIFVGRLSQEKGVATLLSAWRQIGGLIPLKIIGKGPLEAEVSRFAADHPEVEFLGHRPLHEVLNLVGEARLLVMPSIWYETFGRTTMEAFAKGTPVVASNLGAMAELVEDGVTGLLFPPGNASALARCVQELSQDPIRLTRMREAAREEYEFRYTAAENHDLLMDIYREAIERRSAVTSRRRSTATA